MEFGFNWSLVARTEHPSVNRSVSSFATNSAENEYGKETKTQQTDMTLKHNVRKAHTHNIFVVRLLRLTERY